MCVPASLREQSGALLDVFRWAPLGCSHAQASLRQFEQSSPAYDVCVCRFVLQPGALPDGARLGMHLGRLRGRAAAFEATGAAGAGADLADVRVRVQERVFRYALPRDSHSRHQLLVGCCAWACLRPAQTDTFQDRCTLMEERIRLSASRHTSNQASIILHSMIRRPESHHCLLAMALQLLLVSHGLL